MESMTDATAVVLLFGAGTGPGQRSHDTRVNVKCVITHEWARLTGNDCRLAREVTMPTTTDRPVDTAGATGTTAVSEHHHATAPIPTPSREVLDAAGELLRALAAPVRI